MLADLNTGTWWPETQEEERRRWNDPSLCLNPLILFSDGSQVGARDQALSIMAASGNFRNHILKKTCAHTW